jgi:hypothetical protein
MGWCVAQVVEFLFCKCIALSSNPNPTKKKPLKHKLCFHQGEKRSETGAQITLSKMKGITEVQCHRTERKVSYITVSSWLSVGYLSRVLGQMLCSRSPKRTRLSHPSQIKE